MREQGSPSALTPALLCLAGSRNPRPSAGALLRWGYARRDQCCARFRGTRKGIFTFLLSASDLSKVCLPVVMNASFNRALNFSTLYETVF